MKSFKDMNEIIKAENRKKKNLRIYIATLLAVQMLMLPLSGCVSESGSQAAGTGNTATSVVATLNDEEAKVSATTQSSSAGLSADELFTERDLTQTADLSDAKEIALQSGKNVTITKSGVYRVTGS